MTIYYRKTEESIVIFGKTYPYRELIKGFGGRFEAALKEWHIPHSQDSLTAIHKLCKSVGGGPKQPPKTEEVPNKAIAPTKIDQVARSLDQRLQASGALKELASGAPAEADGMRVAELIQQAHLAIKASFPRAVWVLGEIQNLKQRHTGHYFQLADFKEGASSSASTTISCTLWGSQLQALQQKLGQDVTSDLLQDGIKVKVLAQVSLYRDRASLSLNILDLDPRYTKGALALAREELLRELRLKGLDRINSRLSLSPFPFKVGLISADDSRAKSDFSHQLQSLGFPGEIIFYPAQMQGEKTLTEVVAAIKKLSSQGCDLLVLTRGGGSLADLRWFDSKEIALAIAHCPIPLVAAIGHHEDVSVAEEVAYRREKTPTAAADFILSCFQKTAERIEANAMALAGRLREGVQKEEARLQNCRISLAKKALGRLHQWTEAVQRQSFFLQQGFERRLHGLTQTLHMQSHKLQSAAGQRLQKDYKNQVTLQHQLTTGCRSSLAASSIGWERLSPKLQISCNQKLREHEIRLGPIEKALAQADPKPWLDRGWTRLELSSHKALRSVGAIKPGDQLRARLRDGVIEMEVRAVRQAKLAKDRGEK